jgi:LPXTG-motif cell wall-anchored protein
MPAVCPVPRAAAAAKARRIIQLTRGILVTLAVTGAVAAPAAASTAAPSPALQAAAAGSIGSRLVDVPVMARDDPRARLYIVDHLAPGTVIHRRIEVSNTTASTAHILLYAAAATIANGSFLGADGHTPNDLSTWTSVRPGAPDVPAGGRVTATVTIAVPRNAAPGEQYGVVWAETRSVPSAGGAITQVSRVGIRIYLSVGSGGPPAANFTIDSLTAKRSPGGRPVVLATVHNTGGRALDINGTLQLLAGPGGLSAGPFPANLGITLAIGDTEPVTIALDKRLPAGPWDARVTLHSGLLERSARGTLTFPDTGTSHALYLAIAGLVVLLVLGIAALLVVIRRRRQLILAAQRSNPGGRVLERAL